MKQQEVADLCLSDKRAHVIRRAELESFLEDGLPGTR